MKTGILLLGVSLIAALAFAAIGLCLLQRPPPPQRITLSTGAQYRLVGVTYGTEHAHGPILARLVNKLPASVGNFVQRKLGSRLGTACSFSTPQPALGVWFEPVGTNTGPGMNIRMPIGIASSSRGASSTLQAMLADEHGVLAGNIGETAVALALPRTSWSPFPIFFPVVPKRSRVIECCFFAVPAGPEGAYREIGRVHFPNPEFGRFATWKAEPLPATQRVGDLAVRLEHFTTGKPAPGTRLNFLTGNPAPGTHLTKFQSAQKGEETWTGFDFTLGAPGGAETNWALHSADLSDPGRNHLRRYWSLRDQWPYQFMAGTLWSDESAWRLKLEWKRKTGFAPADLVTFTNVPLLASGASGPILRTNTAQGLQLVLMEYFSGARAYGTPMFRLQTPNREGMAFDFVELITDQGEAMVMREMLDTAAAPRPPLTTPPRIILFGKEPPTNAATVNLTWVIQKTRSVEFLVQPPISVFGISP
jgi:hypothetical protein